MRPSPTLTAGDEEPGSRYRLRHGYAALLRLIGSCAISGRQFLDDEPSCPHIATMTDGEVEKEEEQRGSSPASRGGAGVFIEGELGAFYLLAMLAGTEPRGLPGSRLVRVQFQGVDQGFALDDLALHGVSAAGDTLLEIQSKREITFAPKDGNFRGIAGQIARSQSTEVAEEKHLLSVATQRTSRKISGPYQDVLEWARTAKASSEFFARIDAVGVGNRDIREFVATFRSNLISAGVEDTDDAVWLILRRFLILEFDFESGAPLARIHALMLARQVLADEEVERAEALWRALIAIAIEAGKTGGSLDRNELRAKLADSKFTLAGDREYAPARAKLAEMADMLVVGIGRTVAGVHLPRLDAVAALDGAAEAHRFFAIEGGPGVGKSGVLRQLAERLARQSRIIVLDPIATPPGGWLGFAQALDIPGTATSFLGDLAASGGATIFIDGLDMFTDPARQLTVSQLLRAASSVDGFSVITTARKPSGIEPDNWLDDDLFEAFGGMHKVEVGELSDTEVKILVGSAPELAALLDAKHPAARLARNLYRLSRLLKVPSATEIRTEAALARYWWDSADGAAKDDVRPAQRILADLAERALKAEIGATLQADSSARTHLLNTLSLKEVRRDQLDYYHDVLRDWAVGALIAEDPGRLDAMDLSAPVSPRIARGVEFAGRLTLEAGSGCGAWLDLLAHLTPEGAHSSWRRQALLAAVRSEAGLELLDKCSAALLAQGATLFAELCTTIAAVETVAIADLMKTGEAETDAAFPRRHRTNITGTAVWVLRWVLRHAAEIPVQAVGAVIDLVEMQIHLLKELPTFARLTATMLFGWLRQLDVREAPVTMPSDPAAGRLENEARRRMIERLRNITLLMSQFAPDQAKGYLTEVAAERDTYKVKAIRPFSSILAPVAPAELSHLILTSLVEDRKPRSAYGPSSGRAFSFADTDYMPPSPAQPPFLDLLETSPAYGLALIRALVAEAVAHHTDDAEPGDNGHTLMFDNGPRFFPWSDTYLWSRDQAPEYSAASGLKSLESWSHKRIEAGEAADVVLADILGPKGSCAAYLLVAVDVLLSHFSQGRIALVPFIACPELLAHDLQRANYDRFDHGGLLRGENEPLGPIRLADLKARDSRGLSLQDTLRTFLGDDPASQLLRTRLAEAAAKLEPYENWSGWADPRFIGRFAVNYLDRSNWSEVGDKLAYQSPPEEAAQIAQMQARGDRSMQTSETESRIQLAIDGGQYATPETARLAVEYAAGGLPDDSDTDALRSRSTRLIATALLVARDGEDSLLDEHEGWVRRVIDIGLAERADRHSGSHDNLRFSRPALATLAMIHLWLRKRGKADRDALVAIAARGDRCAPPAFNAALPVLLEADAKVFKASARAAFANYQWRWHAHDEDAAVQQRFEAERAATAEATIEAEIAWLDGGEEPRWPEFPDEKPIVRRPLRISVPRPKAAVASTEMAKDEEEKSEEVEVGADTEVGSTLRVDSQAAAQWLKLANTAPKGSIAWGGEVVEAYSAWTTKINGLGLPVEAEIDRSPSDWNHQFFTLFARALLDGPDGRFDADVELVTRLPDQSFGDVAETLIHAADELYFNDADRTAERPVMLRERLAARVMALRRWKYFGDPRSQSIDHDSGGVVAKMLFNTHDPFGGTRCYLYDPVSERLDALLGPIRPLLPGGPTSFVALCVMNLLLATPRARHLDFLLAAADAWFERIPNDAGFWTALGIGQRMVEWFEAVVAETPALLLPSHRDRDRIDRVLGRLVGVGIAEAHEMEKKVEQAAHQG